MTTIDIDPTILRLQSQNFWLDSGFVSSEPGLDGREQIVTDGNRRWVGSVDFVRMRPDAARAAIVIGDRLNGRANILRIPLCNQWSAGSTDPNPTAPATSAGVRSITLTGTLAATIPPSAWFSIDDFAYRIESNTGGAIVFNPPLRQDVPAATVVEMIAPKMQVRLASADQWRPFRQFFRNGQAMSVRVVEAFER